MRNTVQKNAIISVIEKSKRPLTVEEILEEGVKIVPKLGIATVYREIKRLQESANITVVQVPGGAIMYERKNIHHHHHFKCDKCGVVYDLEGCVGHFEKILPKGFKLQNHEIFLYGQCASCA